MECIMNIYSTNKTLCSWILLNSFGLFLFLLSYMNGWVGLVMAADQSYISFGIMLVFFMTLIFTGYVTYKINKDRTKDSPLIDQFNKVRLNRRVPNEDAKEILATKLTNRLDYLREIAGLLVLAGFMGTVIGIIIAIGYIPPDLASNTSQAAVVLSALLNGMGIAFYTTLTGGISAGWLMINHFFLTRESVKVYTRALEMDTYEK